MNKVKLGTVELDSIMDRLNMPDNIAECLWEGEYAGMLSPEFKKLQDEVDVACLEVANWLKGNHTIEITALRREVLCDAIEGSTWYGRHFDAHHSTRDALRRATEKINAVLGTDFQDPWY